ncbi:MAG: hypothetical protein ICV72_01175 [Aldersonia sp.]|nr:hypothetical protein [Aldersonia sp.]
MNVVEQMTELAFARPQPGDSPERIAGWYLAKSRLHEYLAGCGDRDAEIEARLAASARAHANEILRHRGPTVVAAHGRTVRRTA